MRFLGFNGGEKASKEGANSPRSVPPPHHAAARGSRRSTCSPTTGVLVGVIPDNRLPNGVGLKRGACALAIVCGHPHAPGGGWHGTRCLECGPSDKAAALISLCGTFGVMPALENMLCNRVPAVWLAATFNVVKDACSAGHGKGARSHALGLARNGVGDEVVPLCEDADFAEPRHKLILRTVQEVWHATFDHD